MSSELRRFPRLRTGDALALADELSSSASALSPATSHPNQIYAPLGGPKMESAELQKARDAVLGAVAEARGRHDVAPAGEGVSWQTRFDVHVGIALHDALPLSRSEAAVDGVWSWLTLVLLPDVVPHRHASPPRTRLVGGLRNVFSVTWWPVEVLGDLVEPGTGRALQVDEVVGLFERRTLSRDNGLAVDYARTVRSLSGKERMSTTREFAKAVRRVGAHTCWQVADHDRLELLLEEAVRRADAAGSDEVDAGPDEDGPIEGWVRLGSLELPIFLERSDSALQPTGTLDWTSVECPSTAGRPDLVRFGDHVVQLEAKGTTRAGHPRFRGHDRLPNGVTANATVIRRDDDVYVHCELA